METSNDIKLVCQKIDVLGGQLKDLKTELGELKLQQQAFHKEAQQSMSTRAIQVALLEQQLQRVCTDIEENHNDITVLEKRMDTQDTINKVIGGVTAALGTAAAYFGFGGK